MYFKSDREQWPLLANKLEEMAINKYCTTTALMKAVNEIRAELGLSKLDRYSSYTETMEETEQALKKAKPGDDALVGVKLISVPNSLVPQVLDLISMHKRQMREFPEILKVMEQASKHSPVKEDE